MRLYQDLAHLWPIVSPPEDYAEEAHYWRRSIRNRLGPGRHRILELGAGGGHNLSHLTSDFEATAVDLSPHMIEHSRRLNPGVEHHVGDMRTVRLDRTFDAVLVHDAISYMLTEDDLRATFATARAHLRLDGLLLISPDLVAENFEEGKIIRWPIRPPADLDGIEVSVVERLADPDPADTMIESRITYTIVENGTSQIEKDLHVCGLFPVATWVGLMEEAGFTTEVLPLPGDGDGCGERLFSGVLGGKGPTDAKENNRSISAMNPTTRPTVLARLSWKLSSQPETVATEALGHIFAESAEARTALRSFVLSHGVDTGSIAGVKTEVTGDKGDIPDLACWDHDGGERLLIENKFWAGLTSNQPVTYLERLPQELPSALLVVAPSKRIETLWPELKRRARKNFDLDEERVLPEVCKVAVRSRGTTPGSGNRKLMLASWRVLLGTLESQANGVGDQQAVNDIRQLSGLAELQDSEAFLPLSPDQLGPESARLILNLERLVNDVRKRIVKRRWADDKGLAFGRVGGYRRYVRLGGCSTWFGVHYPSWAKLERTPLWVGFQNPALKRGMPRKLERRWGEDAPHSLSTADVIPIDLPTRCEYAEVRDSVVDQLRRLANLFEAIYTAEARKGS